MSDTAYVSTGIALTPRILAGMLTGSSVMGINWAAKFAEIGDNEVFENATIPTLRESLGNAGDDILAALLPPQILVELTADESVIDHVRDGEWPAPLLQHVTQQFCAESGEACEEVYARCERLMTGANTVVFHWNANYIIHMLSVENLDNASVRKAANFYERFADADPVGGLFALFMLSLLGPANFDQVVERLGEAF
ncbi:hypothetical protein AAK684_08370 [Leptogranulimonas caecicola]|jgi:hypothetical protein|uniref:Uncharacterized protein n=2 Tax=Coriobacteriales TaxID=84999 RepID=A0A4S2F181_9ACTN|nr:MULTISPECIES: hypothetical protein [Atopobiaceae]MCI8676628.1 hypothetical protein [Atopobiaceae bacterium]TGY62485.1 hypothetical protein E5334_03400 [Muricaecibacterium torontonense]BCV17993.1 hypothetical protein ATOBIA_N02830 [Atopobiaceae bacterium P1]BDC90402.1 hypothetical protein ATTO_02740 [Leptogranulimonas caecicola]